MPPRPSHSKATSPHKSAMRPYPAKAKQSQTLAWSDFDPTRRPVLAVVGRPNVGKSTLVNRLIGHRHSIVDDQPGVTRDRSLHPAIWCGTPFLVMDTGGAHIDAQDPFAPLINEQVKLALKEADVVVFVVYVQTGLTDDDERVAKWLRQCGKPYILAVNKVDRVADVGLAYEFMGLGLGEPLCISALQGSATVGDMLDRAMELFPASKLGYASEEAHAESLAEAEAAQWQDKAHAWQAVDDTANGPLPTLEATGLVKASTTAPEENKEPLRLCLLGRPNVGKSSLLNALLGQERSIVSSISGTTRDALDTPFSYKGQPYLLVDTAGIRRRTKVEYGVELFSIDRSLEALERSQVVVLVLDAVEGITDQEKKLMHKIIEAGKGLVIAVNKWDLIPNKKPNSAQQVTQDFLREVPSLAFAPFVYLSASKKQRVHKVLEVAAQVAANAQRRLSTNVLNQVISDAVMQTPPHIVANKKLKVYYATQVGILPPTFVLFVNHKRLLSQSYLRYLERKLREAADFEGVPLRFVQREKERDTTQG